MDKIDLKTDDKYIAISNLIIYYTWKNIKMPCENNEFKMSASTWNDKFESTDGFELFCMIYLRLFCVYYNKHNYLEL